MKVLGGRRHHLSGEVCVEESDNTGARLLVLTRISCDVGHISFISVNKNLLLHTLAHVKTFRV